MNKKRKIKLLLLLALLVIIVIAYVVLQKNPIKDENVETETETEIYPVTEIDTALVTSIGTINNGESIDFTKRNGIWYLDGDDLFSVDEDKIESYLDSAGNITSDTCIENVSDLSEYGLDDPVLNLTLQWDENMYLIKVGDYNSVISSYYVCVNDENTIYTITSSQYYSLNKALEDFEKIESETSEEQ